MSRPAFFFSLLLTVLLSPVCAQHSEDERYVPETDPAAVEKIRQWQGLKFGLLMHWGAYSQWSIVESWSICPEEYGWCERTKGSDPGNYNTYVKEYEALQATFNPVGFQPETWAKAAAEAGMKYVVFTTKHHDGFCMFDSKLTDYSVTGPACPFSSNPRSNIAKEIFEAFRAEGLWTGAYFSKPDWHSPFYWDPAYPPRDRNVNYDPDENPERWEKFIAFTHGQVMELLSGYGPMDILWLDGGWVAKESKASISEWYGKQLAEAPTGYLKHRIVNQDIRMDELVEKARRAQPGLIVVDRAVPGRNQNYLTPENRVPEKPLPYPWESCIISGGGWAHTPGAKYMSGREGIHLLIDIVAKGGNLLLNIAPTPEGTWQQGAYDLLGEYAAWMRVNSEAIYETVTLDPCKSGNIAMTRKPGGAGYFLYLPAKDETALPQRVTIAGPRPAEGSKVTLLGDGKPLKWQPTEAGFSVEIPARLRENPPCSHAWALKAERLAE